MIDLPPAVLLGGGLIAVPVARSLARAGVFVYALGFVLDPVRASRACGQFVDLGVGEGVQERWLDFLDGRNAAGGVILPCDDEAVELVARQHRTLADRGYRPVLANYEAMLAMLDKLRTYELAHVAGVRSPRHAIVRPQDDVGALAERIGFPLALKPRFAHRFARHMGIRQKAFVVNDGAELESACDRFRTLDLDVLVMEIVPGPDDTHHSYYTFVDAQGQPLFDFTKRKLRQFRPGFGLATSHVVDHDERTIQLGRRFVTEIGIRGLACVEFKEDARDGELTLIECNPRFTAGHEIVRHAGIDLGVLAYNRVVGRPDPALGRYRTGVRMWHPIEDVRGLVAYRRRGELTFAQWVRSLLHRQHFPLFTWKDPLPTAFSLSRFPLGWLIRRISLVAGERRRASARQSGDAVVAAQEPSAATTASATSDVLAAVDSARPGCRS